MSTESCLTFLRKIGTSSELKQQIKAITDTKEVIALGKRYGYFFDAPALTEASTLLSQESQTSGASAPVPQAPATSSNFYHYEFNMTQVPGFEEITKELSNLKIKPSSVNMDLYEQRFRADDLEFTSMSPAAPDFGQRYEEVMQSHWQHAIDEDDFSRRDFHLVNLDQHTEHPQYPSYFAAKNRMLAQLECFFGSEIRFSGSMWYPPSSYRLWHTNETQTGWRMYLIDFDEPTTEQTHETSFFRYMNPQSKEILTLPEAPKLARFFKIEQEKEKLFWHCIVNATPRNRWSFGFVVPENWMDKFPQTSS
jgi:predicted ribosomally synthesized peptide with nif11-like leader